MIARIRAWLAAPRQLREEVEFLLDSVAYEKRVTERVALMADAGRVRVGELTEQAAVDRARIADLEEQLAAAGKALSKEQLLTAGLTSDVERLTSQNTHLKQRTDVAEAEAKRLRADHTYVTAARCECGGQPEQYWRQRAEELERQARQDRANAVAMADQLARAEGRSEPAEVTA